MPPISNQPPAFEPGGLSYLISAEYVPGTYRSAAADVRKMVNEVLKGFPAAQRVERVRDMVAWAITEMFDSAYAHAVADAGGKVRIVWTHGGSTAGVVFHR